MTSPAVPAGNGDDQRGAVRVGDQVVLGDGFASVDRVGPVWSPFERSQMSGVDQDDRQVERRRRVPYASIAVGSAQVRAIQRHTRAA